jgi:hypothetical protein
VTIIVKPYDINDHSRVKLELGFTSLLSVAGVGKILGMTIWLETGDTGRFKQVGNYASYCRCVGSQRLSNGKKKGQGNHKNGNKYLSWTYVSRKFWTALLCAHRSFLPAQARPHKCDRGDQGLCAQAGTSQLLCSS